MSAPEPSTTVPTTDALRDAVDVMDRLYSPGGCPWDREQTHASLVQYLLEEAHELAEAIETGDRAGMREELGDLLLQVLFHARIASEEPEPFTVDDVAADLVAKLVRRHPHVFAEGVPGHGAGTATDLHAQWDAIKKAEKRRSSVLEGISHTQGALARAQKVLSRSERGGLGDVARGTVPVSSDEAAPADRLGRELFDVVVRAQAAGVDAEAALRAELRLVEAGIVEAERVGTYDGARADGAVADA
ncbi:MazG family protein [Cellulosimicrobium sp. NPDC057127]|uniref:MazG family protein n=1 Tax=Cellulosimicrobium sp. NPDC057127 TaxID=3346026 RepID=UPI0036267C2A